MKQRRRRVVTVRGCRAERLDVAARCAYAGKMREHHAFRQTGGTSGVDDQGGIGAAERERLIGLALLQQPLKGLETFAGALRRLANQIAEPRRDGLHQRVAELLRAFRVDDDRAGFRVAERGGEIIAHQRRVERRPDRAGQIHAEPGQRNLDAAAHQAGHPVSLADAGGAKIGRDAASLRAKVAIGEEATVNFDPGVPRHAAIRVFDEVGDGHPTRHDRRLALARQRFDLRRRHAVLRSTVDRRQSSSVTCARKSRQELLPRNKKFIGMNFHLTISAGRRRPAERSRGGTG